jgi:hypothetical protein
MPYCRRCGAKLEETARFCHVCGTPVAPVAPMADTRPTAPTRRRPVYLLPVTILVAVLITALFISALFFLPFNPVHFNQTNEVPKSDVNNLFLQLQTDVANVNIFSQNLPGNMAVINVTATGNVGLLDDPNRAVNVTFSHQTTKNSEVLLAKVSRTTIWQISYSLKVNCDVYIDPSANLTLYVNSEVGDIVIDAGTGASLQFVDLRTETGNIDCTLSKGMIIAGDISLRTATGSMQFRMDEEDAINGALINLQSTTGSVNIDLTATQRLSSNATVNAQTTTGAVNLFMVIEHDVGARIESETDTGGIRVDVKSFSGNQSPLQSNNYPATSNFIVKLHTNTGGININAEYGSSTILN